MGAAFEQLMRSRGGMFEMVKAEETEMRTYQVCGCGNPDCEYSPPETREAFRRGQINEAALRRMRDYARQNGDGTPTTSFRVAEEGRPIPMIMGTFGGRQIEPEDEDIARLDELRDEVEDWIVEAPTQRFEDIIGNDEALGQLRDAIRAPVEHKELYELYGMKMPKGALLSGPPGCGKTMFARAAASEMRELYGEAVEMISISASELQAPFVGVTEQKIKAIFAFARQYRKVHNHPLLVFIDEAEVLLPDRTGRVRRVAPWEEAQVATFLAEMDGMLESGAFVLLASNRPEVIDSAVLRDGRCDFKIKVERPNQEALEGILKRNFTGIFTKEKEEALVFAALEGFLDPHRVLLDFHMMVRAMEDWFKSRGIEVADEKSRARLNVISHHNFLFEHIVNGAMAASVPMRAKRRAFTRDRAAGTKAGVTTEDVVLAVRDIFEESKGLDHSYALGEFMKGLEAEMEKVK